jgi:hypothetical protein
MSSTVEDTRYWEVYKVAMAAGEIDLLEVRLAGGFSDEEVPYTVEEILLEFTREQRYRNGFGRGCGK